MGLDVEQDVLNYVEELPRGNSRDEDSYGARTGDLRRCIGVNHPTPSKDPPFLLPLMCQDGVVSEGKRGRTPFLSFSVTYSPSRG